MILYRFVDDQKASGFPVERICEIAGVSRAASYWIRSWAREPPPSLPDVGAGTMSATTRVPSTYSWRTSASTLNLTHTTTGNNRFRHI